MTSDKTRPASIQKTSSLETSQKWAGTRNLTLGQNRATTAHGLRRNRARTPFHGRFGGRPSTSGAQPSAFAFFGNANSPS